MLAFTSTDSNVSRRAEAARSTRLSWLARLIAGAVLCIALPAVSHAQGGLLPGEGFVTKFSGTTTVAGAGGPRTVIDLAGTVGTAIDLRAPGFPADGRHWLDEPHLFSVTAGDVGQVFGVTLDDASPPNIYLTATSAFGLHRNADSSGWMDGMWGPGGGPGTVYRLDAANGYQPEIFADITLDGRANSGAGLGNIAFDKWHHQLFVSDLETGMIHRLAVADGADLGSYDHGVTGRSNFVDALTGANQSLAPVAFDPATAARVADCPSGDFARTPSCWNFADFRRRVWGLDVRHDPGGNDVRLYYAVWGSQGFGNPDWATAGEDQQNSVWSVAIAADGSFDASSVRREFFLPEFFRSPEAIARAGISNPVADIAFPKLGSQNVMLVAERGGVRNLGLSADNAFAYPDEARVLRYTLDAGGVWQPAGRYDVGFTDRKNEGPPYVRAGAAGGAAFGMGYDASGRLDPAKADTFVWMTGDGLCAPDGACFDPATGTDSDSSQVTGLQGQAGSASEEVIPDAAFQPYPAPGPAYPAAGPSQSYMIDADINVDASGAPIPAELARNDATRVGDLVVFQQAQEKPDLRIAKRALATACRPGEDCRFEITITNVGDVPYSGPLAVRDTPAEGAVLSVPPPDWTCSSPFAGIQECSHVPLDLGPGAEISFAVSFQVPSGWSRSAFENCIELTTPGAGEDTRTYNNSACGYGPTAEPGTPYDAPDLRLTKFGLDGQCDWAGNCWFAVRITNVGAAPYTGGLGFHDEIDFPGATLFGWAPGPEWMCGPVGGSDFNCTHPPTTLAPGDFREVTLRVAAPPPTPGHTHVRNCGWVDWGAAPGDYNPGNEHDCATISRFPPGDPGATALLEIEKDAEFQYCFPGAGFLGGWLCEYRVTITNTGGAPYLGPFAISDEVTWGPGPFQLDNVSPPWTCIPGVHAGLPQTCTRPPVPGGLQPGDHISLNVGLEVTPTAPEGSAQRNCATIKWDVDGDGIAENHTSCAITIICTAGSATCPHDLGVLKVSQPTPCFPGFPCEFTVYVDNISDNPYPVPVVITDVPDLGVGAPNVVWPPGLVCAPAAGAYACTAPFAIPPHAELGFDIQFPIPPGYPSPSFKNCARVPPGPDNTLPFNDEDCATAYVPFPDLLPFGGTVCQRGADCTLDLGIKNGGLLPFVGSAGVRGTLSPAVPIVSITPQTPGITCSVTGQGTYECRGQSLSIPPGESVKWQAVINIAEDFPADQITHTKDMIWPDTRVKDKRPDDDRSVSIITIEGKKLPPPPPQPTQVAAPDLAVTKTSDRASCVAGEPCGFTVTIRNVGAGAYVGPLRIADTAPPGATLASSGPSPWSCNSSGAGYTCAYPSTTLAPGASKTLSLVFVASDARTGGLENCAALSWDDTARVMAVQNALNALGFDVGAPDGKIGPQTSRAIQDYQSSIGLPTTGRIDDALLRRLFGSWGDGDANARNDRSCAVVTLRPAPPPQITCTGGRVSSNQCICPPNTERQQFGTNAYRCVPPQITCKGGTVRNNECLCPKGTEVQQVGRTAFACVPTITCKNGTVQNGQCLCPRGTDIQQVGRNAFACVPTITCKGGTVQNGQCLCPRGTDIQQVGRNAFACVPTITCKGGTVQNGQCVCPPNTEVQQVGRTAFACVPTLTCKGGTVQNGQCICPEGTTVRPVGRNVFACVPVQPPPTIRCSGGTVQNNECVCPTGMEARRVSDTAYRCVKSQGTTQETPSITAPTVICSGGSVSNGQCLCPQGTVRQQAGTNAYRCTPALQLLVPQLRVVPQVK